MNDHADLFGRSIHDGNCILSLTNIAIKIGDKMSTLPAAGQAIYTKGTEVVSNVTIEIDHTITESIKNAYLVYRQWNFIKTSSCATYVTADMFQRK